MSDDEEMRRMVEEFYDSPPLTEAQHKALLLDLYSKDQLAEMLAYFLTSRS